ncbi:MAG: thymidine phosphorylase [Candidatus Eremiobacteraeota bacterium]|nr:thymidine phosphorylase [Candidatus Eremiobacteraeota bacterium]
MTAFRSIVDKKKHAKENTQEEIAAFVRAYCADQLDAQLMVEWLRAVMAAGMSLEETAALTEAMARSGEQLDWRDVSAPVVDKHSTGGVGDEVSLIAVPLAAACGVKVAKLSGSALGHTGGTLDKLACIPGLRTALSRREFQDQVAGSVGCAIAQASAELAPADKKLYELRHRSGTIASVPLITASILSKKIAGGAPELAIDVKAGSCAFMQTQAEAQVLASSLSLVGTRLGRQMHVLITDMDAPLANSVGDALELAEALETLEGGGASRLREVALAVTAAMIGRVTGKDQADPRDVAARALREGEAFRRFGRMAKAQGGDVAAFNRSFKATLEITAASGGFVERIDGRALGEFVAANKRDQNQPVGLRLLKRRGEPVEKNEPILRAFGIGDSSAARSELSAAIGIGPRQIPEGPAVIATVLSSLPQPAP